MPNARRCAEPGARSSRAVSSTVPRPVGRGTREPLRPEQRAVPQYGPRLRGRRRRRSARLPRVAPLQTVCSWSPRRTRRLRTRVASSRPGSVLSGGDRRRSARLRSVRNAAYDHPLVSPIRVANAPCSYGAFEITVGRLPNIPDALDVLESMAEAGYEGTELGPPGYLGARDELQTRLGANGLELVGGYIPIRFSEPERLGDDLRGMNETLDYFDAAGAPNARPVFADGGSPERAARPGASATDRSVGLDPAGWKRFADGVARAADAARGRGYEPTFHHHTATYVEAPWEIERMLELTDVDLLLDTGHLALGGGDPTAALRDWGERINHLHVKDVRNDVLAGVIADGADMPEAWRRGVFCELGTGDVDLDGFFAELARSQYAGWLVVEQDTVPQSPQDAADAEASQMRHRAWLTEHAGL